MSEQIKLVISSIYEKTINSGCLRALEFRFGTSNSKAMFLKGHKVPTKNGFVSVDKLKKGDEILATIETIS